ncbi:expressed unknown protein [Seminavis robusta]|uniref:Uncharacterized protein n=1 Tax=Seminavis robusta TaxID=568900 RepID=A0A9N8H249_9STRA|nr:expressed unknown protein [Seminavis robusta]|eukprot:Sro4_g003050.1 n/a (350) ;mRNA; r:32732-33781
MATGNETDPSGFVSNPPSTVVKIINTAREDMNGQFGIVVQFQQDRGRYLVHVTSTQQVVAMKPENLVKASYVEQAQAYWQQASRDPQIQQVLNRLSAYLPPGVSPKQLGIGLAVTVLALIYVLGFSRTMMLFSFVMLFLMVIGQDLLAGADPKVIVQNAPMRFQTIVREQVPGGQYLVGKPYERYAHMGLAAFLIVFFVRSMMPVTVPASATTTSHVPLPSRNLVAEKNQKMAEEFYKLGFDDAKADKEYRTSFPDFSTTSFAMDDTMDDLPDYPMPPTKSQGGVMSKFFSVSSAMSIMYVGRTLIELGKDADGSWSMALFQANLATLEPWKMGLMGLSVYRLVSSLMS